jgi:Adenylate and Guanylate cyclase catalytic domain
VISVRTACTSIKAAARCVYAAALLRSILLQCYSSTDWHSVYYTARVHYASLTQLVVIGRACLAAAQAVLEQGGLVNKILMDEKGLCLIYAFGTPGSSFEDNSLRALGSAASSRRQFSSSSGRRGPSRGSGNNGGSRSGSGSGSSSSSAECIASIGVATGQVCAALLGLSTVRCEYALVGDTVNLAARLAAHAAASGFGMLACPTTAAPLLGKGTQSFKQVEGFDEFRVERVGALRPKGKSADISIYEVRFRTLFFFNSSALLSMAFFQQWEVVVWCLVSACTTAVSVCIHTAQLLCAFIPLLSTST